MNIQIGNDPGTVQFALQMLTKHLAVLGGTGSGKTTAILNIIEQVMLGADIPVIIVDRKGDLCGYGNYPEKLTDTERAAWDVFYSKVEPIIYTPGHPGGRGLAIPLVPDGLRDVDRYERQNATNAAAHALADMMGYKHKGKELQARAILFQAFDLMVEGGFPVNLDELTKYIYRRSPKFLNTISMLDLELLNKLVTDLTTFALDKGRILLLPGDPLTMDSLLGRTGRRGGRTRMSIISTKFLGEATLFWVSQLLIEAGRWSSKNPSPKLQALMFLDEADAYMPARGMTATKKPLLDMLKRGRSAGLGMILATQSPGDMDYTGRDNIQGAWMFGSIREDVALRKIRGVVQDSELLDTIRGQTVGQFVVTADGKSYRAKSRPSMLHTVQLPEDKILAIARKGPPTVAQVAEALKTRRHQKAAQES